MLQEDIAATEKIEGEGLTNVFQPSNPRHHQEETFSNLIHRLHGHTLKRKRTNKYLGVTINQYLEHTLVT